jgi:hypothetical protein
LINEQSKAVVATRNGLDDGAGVLFGTHGAGSYSVRSQAGAFCAIPVSGTHTVTEIATPATPGTSTPTSVCQGSNLTFVASGATNYNWEGAVSGDGNNKTAGASAGEYKARVRAYNLAGSSRCYGGWSGTVTGTIVANAGTPGTSTPASVCQGSNLTFVASGATNYNWEGAVSGDGNNKTAGTSAGEYKARVRAYNLAGSSRCYGGWSGTVTGTIVANAGTPGTSTPTSVCQGSNLTFTASGATNYNWEGAVSGDGNNKTAGTSAGEYKARVRAYNLAGSSRCYGGWSGTVTGTIVANAGTPGTSTPTSVCQGSNLTFVASGATNYNWEGAVSGDGNNKTAGTSAGEYKARVRAYNLAGSSRCYGGWSGTVTGTIVANAGTPGTSTPTSVCQGSNLTFVASGATNYNWEGAVSGDGNNKTAGTSAGEYKARVRAYNLAGSDRCYSGWSGTVTGTIVANAGTPGTSTPASVCQGSNLTFTASGATNYNWEGAVSGDGNNKTAGTSTGEYKARVRAYNLAGSDRCYSGWSGTVTGKISSAVTITQTGGSNYVLVGTTMEAITYTVSSPATMTYTATSLQGLTITKTNSSVVISGNPTTHGYLDLTIRPSVNSPCQANTTVITVWVHTNITENSSGGPATAKTAKTWRAGSLIWSDQITKASLTDCTGPTVSGWSTDPSNLTKASYADKNNTRYYNYNCILNNLTSLCPPANGWRVPNYADESDLFYASGGRVQEFMKVVPATNFVAPQEWDGSWPDEVRMWLTSRASGCTEYQRVDFSTSDYRPWLSCSYYQNYGYPVRCVKNQ